MTTNKRNKNRAIVFAIMAVAILAVSLFAQRGNGEKTYRHDKGFIFGTSYNVTYQAAEDLHEDILQTLNNVDNSLSPFNEKSIITAVNNNQPIEVDDMFTDVFHMAAEVNKETDGAFDITVAPLVNAWGFGFKTGKMPEGQSLDSLREIVGFSKVSLDGRHVKKSDPRIMLDCSAIAKGYGVEQVAKLMRSKGVENFMVEIGGEIVVQGNNASQKPWNIGVTKPTDDSLSTNQELQTILSITNTAMATSGNYRNFYYKNGRKYAHTIDPATGMPVQHSILSATVLANDCAVADAYATSFMVMGMEKAQEVLKKHTELKAYFIYTDQDGKNAVWFSPQMKEYIRK